MSEKTPQCLTLPITFPTLFIGSVTVPYPMSREEYDALLEALELWKDALIGNRVEVPQEPPHA